MAKSRAMPMRRNSATARPIDFTAEDSIYVHPDRMGRGVGRALLAALLERSAAYGFRTIVAVIGGGEPASIALHAKCGFREAGRLHRVGFKFGQWLDSVYMQIELQSGRRALLCSNCNISATGWFGGLRQHSTFPVPGRKE